MATSSPQRRSRDPERTRRAITEALLSLLLENKRGTAEAIAERAGVSRRSVFVHFADLSELYLEVGRLQSERLQAEVETIDPLLPLPERIDRFVAQQERVYEAMTPIRRVVLRGSSTSPTVRRQLENADAWQRGILTTVFATELTGEPELAEIVEAATSWGAWFQLRRLSPPERHLRFTELLTRLLGPRGL